MSPILNVVEISDMCYLDADSHTLAIHVDRITLAMGVDEFLDFYFQISAIKDFLDTSPHYVIGKTMDGDIKEMFVPCPDESEYT